MIKVGQRFEKKWVKRSVDPALVRKIENARDPSGKPLTRLRASLLAGRGIDSVEKVDAFLNPRLRTGLRSPLLFPDMDRATERLLRARNEGELVCVWGDYDVDGVTGSSILLLFLREIGMDPLLYIPHRTREGYGLNTPAIEQLAEAGVGVVVTADCGASGHKEILRAQELGIDVIVCDHHHVPDEKLPAYAVLNPMEPDCPFSFSGLSGAGVAFYLLMGLRMKLRARGEPRVPDLKLYLDLVCLGTVADLVPLTEENRVIVTHGIQQLSKSKRPGICALRAVSGDGEIGASYIGYKLGPRINAGGRLADATKAVELLTTCDSEEANKLAAYLEQENVERRVIEDQILQDAVLMVQAALDRGLGYTVVLASSSWHAGVIGIVASRLLERYGRPTILIAVDGEMGKGSGRCGATFNLYEGIKACSQWLQGYGGHKRAAGLSIRKDDVETFAEAFESFARTQLRESDLLPVVEFDQDLDLGQVRPALLNVLDTLEPHGQGNPEPVFRARNVEVLKVRTVGDLSDGKVGHLKLALRSSEEGHAIDAIWFGMGDADIEVGGKVELLYTPSINTWNGRSTLQLRVRDLKTVTP